MNLMIHMKQIKQQDLKHYSDDALELEAWNDWDHYQFIKNTDDLSEIRKYFEKFYRFTDTQWSELVKSIDEHAEENKSKIVS